MAYSEFGTAFLKILKSKGLNRSELANLAGLNRSTFTSWTKEDTDSSPKRESLDAVSDALGLELQVLRDLAKKQWPDDALKFLSDKEQKLKKESFTSSPSKQKQQPKPYIPEPEADIYFPLKLAIEVEEKVNNPDEALQGFFLDYPGWVEQEEKWRTRLDIKPANEFLDELVGTPGLHVIVGEPGGGKTTLLRHLGKQLLERNMIPLLVPLREVGKEGIVDFFERQKKRFNLDFDALPYLKNDLSTDISLIWLFDGWDELPRDLQEQWAKLIRDQSRFPCFVSCRIAQYSNYFGKPYYLMGLYPDEQKNFLNDLAKSWKDSEKYDSNFRSVTGDWVSKLHSKLQENKQLKRLAGSPLLLTLIAKTNNPTTESNFPLKRIDFYRNAFRSLIQQRQNFKRSNPQIRKLRKFLSQLSYETNQDGIKAEFPAESFDTLAESFQLTKSDTDLIEESNIIKVASQDRWQWLHLTFAEWLLAEYWLDHKDIDLLGAINEHWQHPDYDEPLTLLWSVSKSEKHTLAINYLTKVGVTASKKEVGKSRSAIRLLIRLYTQNNSVLSQDQFAQIWSQFEDWPVRRFVLAQVKNLTEVFTTKLSEDKVSYVRRTIAEHDILSNNVLAKLAVDEDIHVRRSISEYNKLPDFIMEKLSNDKDFDIRLNIAKRDNLPDNIVHRLANDNDSNIRKQIAGFNILPSYIIDKLVNDENPKVRERIAARDNISDSILEKLINDKEIDIPLRIVERDSLSDTILGRLSNGKDYIRWKIALRDKLPDNILYKLADDEVSIVRKKIAEFDKLPNKILKKLANDDDPDVRWSIATRVSLPHKILNILVTDKASHVRRRIAARVKLPDTILDKLADDDDSDVRMTIAKREDLPTIILNRLADDDDSNVRMTIAEREDLPTIILNRLADDNDANVRMRLTECDNLSSILLNKFASDNDYNIRQRIAQYNNLPKDILTKLANDDDSYVRMTIAGNENLPKDILLKLASDEDSDVRRSIAGHNNLPNSILEKLAMDLAVHVRRSIAECNDLPDKILEKFASDEDYNIRSLTAEHNNLPYKILKKLANDDDSYVRGKIAARDILPKPILDKLTSDEDSDVRCDIAERENLPESVLDKLANDEVSYVRKSIALRDNLPDRILEKLASDKDSDIRWKIAERENLPESVLDKLTSNEDLHVRWRIATHNNLPSKILVKLASDKDSDVRWRIAQNPDVCWEWLTD